jgi:hypothetical protein
VKVDLTQILSRYADPMPLSLPMPCPAENHLSGGPQRHRKVSDMSILDFI